MIRIVLIHPGASLYDEQGRIQGNLDIPLCDAGRAQALAAVPELQKVELAALYCAPCAAALETADLLAKPLKLKVKTLDELENLNQGLWQGMLIDDVKHKQTKVYKQWLEHPESVCPPNGEMLGDALERIEAGLEKVVKKHRQGGIGLVVPEPLASLIRYRLTGCGLGDLWKVCGRGGKIEQFELHPTEWRTNISLELLPLNGHVVNGTAKKVE